MHSCLSHAFGTAFQRGAVARRHAAARLPIPRQPVTGPMSRSDTVRRNSAIGVFDKLKQFMGGMQLGSGSDGVAEFDGADDESTLVPIETEGQTGADGSSSAVGPLVR